MTMEDLGWELEDSSASGGNQSFQWRKRGIDGRVVAYENDETWWRDFSYLKQPR